jgi:hypothetical protein
MSGTEPLLPLLCLDGKAWEDLNINVTQGPVSCVVDKMKLGYISHLGTLVLPVSSISPVFCDHILNV